MTMWRRLVGVIVAGLGFVTFNQLPVAGHQDVPSTKSSPAASTRSETYGQLVKQYCVTCHSERSKTGNLTLESVDVSRVSADAAVWERVVRKVKAGVMPPAGMPRPDEATLDRLVSWLEHELDRAASARPDPGRTEALHRLNRAEYKNAIRDLLALDIDVSDLLPADDASYGFDNVASGLKLSQSLLEGYVTAGKKISRTALGSPPPTASYRTYAVSQASQQHQRVEGLPFGTRGGLLVQYTFPTDGEYEISIEISNEDVLPGQTDQLEVLIDGERVELLTVGPPGTVGGGRTGLQASAQRRSPTSFDLKLPIKAGPHAVGATFYRTPSSIVEDLREPVPNPELRGHSGGSFGPRPTLKSVRVAGPVTVLGAGSTPSRTRIFVCRPKTNSDERACAEKILLTLARRAYRRAVGPSDVRELLEFFEGERREGGSFDDGIELALWRLLLSPEFLYRIETPDGSPRPQQNATSLATPGKSQNDVYAVGDFTLASRLSFFLWSSIPDDELLKLAETGKLKQPAVLEQQVRRMLADSRAAAFTENFAGQWLQLRNMDRVKPGDPYYLTFDDTLRFSMRRETELLFNSIVRENRSVMDLLNANYTFLNERLAIHYGIPNVQGSHFRRVPLPENSPRRGILGHGSVLTITSHAIRTSPVIRGKWILTNILGTPPPAPPPNVPAFKEETTPARSLSMRERMAQHRNNPACAGCHSVIDPAGFALENFDPVGKWRAFDESHNAVDTSGSLPDGSKFTSFAEFRNALIRRPERFVSNVAERLLTYALGRGLEYYDMSALRQIVRESASHEYRMQALIAGIVKSYPFRMRRRQAEEPWMAASR